MSRPQPALARFIALGVAVALLTGCSTTSPPASTSSPQVSTASPQPTVSPVCTAADALADALTAFKDTVTAGATVEQVRAARDQVVASYDALVKEIGNVAKGRVDAVVAAHDRFAAAVNDVPDDATLAEAADSLRDEAANFQGALSDLVTEAKC
ncbi:uncharacterized protein YPO0396 [Arthrobacter ginsengisoli]|uniref:Uncharacterized protein YPO0396 n=1 Tax=Arthrobacter ginsengisoli TaxID=1356565 RepID=A0ABU1UCB1_9MICC|nr:hypothetical protein [Arthrobacter ginsengisoli]MDR7082766.1 uncharacterized protein YPO0396 [Arthrobacter ginsengisoli]